LSEKISASFSHKNPRELTLSIFGFAFKKNTGDTRCSPVAYLVYYLAEEGFTVKIHDPLVTKEHFELEMEL